MDFGAELPARDAVPVAQSLCAAAWEATNHKPQATSHKSREGVWRLLLPVHSSWHCWHEASIVFLVIAVGWILFGKTRGQSTTGRIPGFPEVWGCPRVACSSAPRFCRLLPAPWLAARRRPECRLCPGLWATLISQPLVGLNAYAARRYARVVRTVRSTGNVAPVTGFSGYHPVRNRGSGRPGSDGLSSTSQRRVCSAPLWSSGSFCPFAQLAAAGVIRQNALSVRVWRWLLSSSCVVQNSVRRRGDTPTKRRGVTSRTPVTTHEGDCCQPRGCLLTALGA